MDVGVAVPVPAAAAVVVAVAGALGSAGLRRLLRRGNVMNLGSGRTSRSRAVFVAACSCSGSIVSEDSRQLYIMHENVLPQSSLSLLGRLCTVSGIARLPPEL